MATIEEMVEKAVQAAVKRALLDAHPVGTIYLTIKDENPATKFGGTWEKLPASVCLQTADTSHGAGTTIAAGLPNITGTNAPYGIEPQYSAYSVYEGAFYLSAETGATNGYGHTTNSPNGVKKIKFDASRSSAIYGKSTTVQPPAYALIAWRRTA